VTDFLNAAFHARPEMQRDPADLRLAYAVLTTRWANLPGRRLGAGDVVALHRAYGRLRLRGARGRLNREALLIGASTLVGDWFENAVGGRARPRPRNRVSHKHGTRRVCGRPVTALRTGGLLGQTFEIEVIAQPAARSLVSTRGSGRIGRADAPAPAW
jgi:hypothetical protein